MLAAIPFPPLSPELFSIDLFGFHLALRWYALAYIAGILLGWRFTVMTVNRAHLWYKEQPPMTPAQIEDLMTWIILGIIVGGRLGYVLFYQPGYYLSYPTEIPMIWQGGMSFHGGFLGTVIAAWIFCARQNIPKLATADMLALAAPAGLLFGRLANFINAELWGRQTDVPWGVIFPGDHAQDCGQPLGEICARHPSQLYEAGLEGLALGLIILFLVSRGGLRKPGLIAGTFFAGYGAARFFVEFFRQPDAQFQSLGNPLGLALQVNGYGLTMGQILTIPMIAVGVWFILRANRGSA